jgi:hypothetical protein
VRTSEGRRAWPLSLAVVFQARGRNSFFALGVVVTELLKHVIPRSEATRNLLFPGHLEQADPSVRSG